MSDTNKSMVGLSYHQNDSINIPLIKKKQEIETSENIGMHNFDKKRKKLEIDINRTNTPSPVELKKMKFELFKEIVIDESYKIIRNPHVVQYTSFEDAYQSYLANLTIDLPDCHSFFPWLHEFEDNRSFLDIKGNEQLNKFKRYHTTIIKTYSPIKDENSGEYFIENSGILKGSLNARVFFKELSQTNKTNLKDIINQELDFYNNSMIALGLKNWTIADIEDLSLIFDICEMFNIVPILKNDSIEVKKSAYGRSLTQPQADPSFYRRFDIQPSKMLLMSTNILLYCYHKSHKKCQYCNGLKLIIQFSYYNIIRNYNIFGNLQDEEIFKKAMITIKIIDMSNIDNLHPFIGTPLLPITTLNKPENQLVSKFDTHILNNWGKDLFYREKLEISKISSNTKVSERIWIGNSIDFEVSKMGLVLNLQHPHYYSLKNSICGLDTLDADVVNDLALFNFPECIWDVFVQCRPIFGDDRLFDVSQIENDLQTNQNISLNFPSSGSLGLGNLTLQLIKQIFQCIDLIYQLSKQNKRKILIYSQDGYSESSFLLLAYIIYSQRISLKEAMVYAHSHLKRPFFIFPNDLEVLNYLQILLLSKSVDKDSFVAAKGIKIERFDITNEDFTNMFFNTSLLSTSKSELNCMINLKGPLPSQIMDYLYLGSLKHAENLALLTDLQINCVISVGERLSWLNNYEFVVTKTKSNHVNVYKSKTITVYHIDNLLDNGQDPLLHSLNDILDFIDTERQTNASTKILVHCMVGVSRSATVVIAEVMKEYQLSLLRAYLYVRVRRLNIIIQPSLLFMYELLKYEEFLITEKKKVLKGVSLGCKRSVDWENLSKSIDELNENYLKNNR
ncbi:hypothetical protein QEN19_003216 [Hanseniaspora menglaensis]